MLLSRLDDKAKKRVYDNKVKVLSHIAMIQQDTASVKLEIGGTTKSNMVDHTSITIISGCQRIIKDTLQLIDNLECVNYHQVEAGLKIEFY